MDLARFLISCLLFVFAVCLFPTLNDTIINATLTDNIAPLIQSFPIIFITVTAIFPVYFAFKKDES